jgi:DNA-binding NtrC family response regulator
MNNVKHIQTLSDKERELLLKVLTKTDWDLAKASRLLQIPFSVLRQKITEHGLKPSPVADAFNLKPAQKNKRREK